MSCIPKEIQGVFQEVWNNSVQLGNLSSLIELLNVPVSPHWTGIIKSFNSTLNASQVGQRLRAYITIPESGLYNFDLSCHNVCVIRIDTPQGNIFTRCQNLTTGFNMTAGIFYKVTVLHIGGTRNKDVRISLISKNGSKEDPITEDYLVAYQADGILGEFTPGMWESWSSCNIQTVRQTRQRYCQRFPPVYSQLNSSFHVNESRTCTTSCPVGWFQYQTSCYLLSSEMANWLNAIERCTSLKSQLVTIANRDENDLVASFASSFFWIGAEWNETTLNYSWVDGSTILFTERWKNKKYSTNLCVGICGSVSNNKECENMSEWYQDDCFHLHYFVCERKVYQAAENRKCNDTSLGFENGLFPDENMRGSSTFLDKYPAKARLAGEDAWCPQTNSSQEYLEISLSSLHSICAIATQGFHKIGAFTTTYRLQLSTNGTRWEWYMQNNGHTEILQGNVDSYGIVKSEFRFAPRAQYVRIWPESFCVHPCLRIEIYGITVNNFTGPVDGSPVNISVASLTMRSALVAWQLPLYVVMSRKETYQMKLLLSKQGEQNIYEFRSDHYNRIIKELDLYTAYCVSVLVSHSIRDGPWSECVSFTTPSVCPDGWSSHGGHCYRAFSQNTSWKDANNHCLNKNSELVSIHSPPENQLAASLLNPGSQCAWLGLRNEGINTTWTDGSFVNVTILDLFEGSSNQDFKCVAYVEQNKSWKAMSCSFQCTDFLCKRKDYNQQDCSERPLGMENLAIPETSLAYKNQSVRDDMLSPRLSSSGGLCFDSIVDVYLRVNLRSSHLICAISTQGHSQKDWYVVEYMIELAVSYSKGDYYMENGTKKIFEANNNRYAVKKNTILESGVVAKYVTLWPTNWVEKPCFRMEIYGKSYLERVPTRAPENVSYWFSADGLEVAWSPLLAYFRGFTLLGYEIDVIDRGNYSLDVGRHSDEPPFWKLIKGIKSEQVYCVEVYGFTTFGRGVSSSCNEATMRLYPSSNVTAINITSSSVVLQWKPYAGDASLLGYNLLVLKQGSNDQNLKQLEGDSFNLTVCANVTVLKVGNLSSFTRYCVQIRLITQMGNEDLSECFFFYTKDVIVLPPPKALAYQDFSSSIVTVQWQSLEGLPKGLLQGYVVLLPDANTTIFAASCMTNITGIFAGCIQVAAFTREGLGNKTECLSILNPKEETVPKVSASMRRTLTTIQLKWDHETLKRLYSDIQAYVLLFTLVRVNGEPVAKSEPKKIIICGSFEEYLLTNLSKFSQYSIQMAIFTANGVGKYSDPTYGETCPCEENITVPASVLNIQDPKANLNVVANELQKVISDLVIQSCGYCEQHGETKLVHNNDSNSQEIIFPVTKTSYGRSAYSKFIPVIQVPGVIVITRQQELGKILTEAASSSILQVWPIIVITFTMAVLAGITMWFLDSKDNPENFPHQFLKGAGQGFWWSFISMTTVGYGDLCPKSIPAKLFAILWFLVGLVLFAVFMSTLASLLTVTTVKYTIGSTAGTDTKTVAVVADSPENRVALGSLSGKLTIGSKFPDIDQLVDALKTKQIDALLVDSYTPVKRKDLFNGSWFEVAELFEAKISQGLILQGSSMHLADELSKLIVAKNVQTNYLLQRNQDQEDDSNEEADTAKEPVTFFDPSSPHFTSTFLVSLAALGVLFCLGVLYHMTCYNRTRFGGAGRIRPDVPDNEEILDGNDTMETAVEDFYESFIKTYKELRQKCKDELIQLAKMKHKGIYNFNFGESQV